MNPPVVTEHDARQAVAEVLSRRRRRTEAVDPDASLRSLSLDSLDVAELFLAVESRVGRRLDPKSAGKLVYVRDLTRLRPS